MSQTEVKKKQIQFYTYVPGILMLLVFGRAIGSNGLAYLMTGMGCVGVFLALTTGNTADVLGRMLKYRRKRSRFMDAALYRKRVFGIQAAISIILFGLLFLFSDVIAEKIFSLPGAGLIIRILSPVLLLRTADAVFLGYFQSFGSHVQSVIADLLRLLLFVCFGQLFGRNMLEYGEKVSSLLKNDDFYGMYGAAGLSVAILAAEFIVWIVLLIFYILSDRQYDMKKSKEGLQRTESMKDALLGFGRMSAGGLWLRIMPALFAVLSLILLSDKESVGIWGGQYLLLCAIPLFLICARLVYLYARIIYTVKGQNTRQIRDMISLGMQYTWCAGILTGVIPAVLAPQITTGFFEGNPLLLQILPYGALYIPLLAMLIYFVMVHGVHNRWKDSILVLSGGMVVFVLLGILMSGRMEVRIQAIACAGWMAMGVSCVILGMLTVRKYRLQAEYVRSFLFPLVCVGIVGLLVYFLARILTPHIGNCACFYIGTVLTVLVYLVLLAVCRVFNDNDIKQIYGRLGRKLLSVIFK